MNRRQLITAAFPLVLSAHPAVAKALGGDAIVPPASSPASAGGIETIATAFLNSGHGVGLSVAAMRNGKLLLAEGYGIANLETNTPVNAASVFRAGSITKQFAAAAVMRLVEAGRLDLDALAAKYIPEMASTGPITVRMLLNQTSGLRNYSGREFAEQQKIDRTPKQMLDYILGQPELMNFSPGDRFEYSNSNYFLLGVMVERVGARPLQDTLGDLIRDAGLKQTAVDHASDIVPQRADGYALIDEKPGRFRKADYVSMDNAGGAGVLRSTPSDLVKWHQALFAGRVVKKRSLQQMLKTGTLNNGRPVLRDDSPIAQGKPAYGFGLEVGTFDGLQAIGHGGSVPGYTSYVVTFPRQRLSAAVMMNVDPNQQMPFAAILRTILAAGSTVPG
ncbi:serine hydrolase domain-containing protein [Sphingosinicella rhizophila]|uniref:Serine hydrolase domain-containing protein n=1 Tax=Sphingosinicella rhizophila TaxID=3050082 RepID=A0ABU3Q5K6_9SPHN|nr:serine hydrolase domain-containing protein [Sphingosinicella sp. GR2756]MDT9598698.1 serine hydrolase domain-containing protein [Sphingosinicella sp. GR2756]